MRLFAGFNGIKTVFVDGGYTGKLIDWAKAMFDCTVEVVTRTEAHQFKILPKTLVRRTHLLVAQSFPQTRQRP